MLYSTLTVPSSKNSDWPVTSGDWLLPALQLVTSQRELVNPLVSLVMLNNAELFAVRAWMAVKGEMPAHDSFDDLLGSHESFEGFTQGLTANNDALAEDFLTGLYRNLLDREPDKEGFAYWLNLLQRDSDALSKAELVQHFQYSALLNSMNSADDYQEDLVVTLNPLTDATIGATEFADMFDFSGDERDAHIIGFASGIDRVDLADINAATSLINMLLPSVGIGMSDRDNFLLDQQAAGAADSAVMSAAALNNAFNNDLDMMDSFAIISDDDSSAIYALSNDAADSDGIVADDLTLIGTIDSPLGMDDIVVG